MSELPNSTLVPFVLAVTGHRDLRPQDLDSLRSEVREVFAGVRSRMPNTPIALLTGLAEGADQLVADVALEQNVLVIGVFPLPLDIFREQMSDTAKQKFDALFSLCYSHIMLPLEGRKEEEIRNSEVVRADCYEALARFLASHGQALIALWDGEASQKRGGTANVVHYVRSGTLNQRVEEAESRYGVVYQIVTPRLSHTERTIKIRTHLLGSEALTASKTSRLWSTKLNDSQIKSFALLEENTERFNSEIVAFVDRKTDPGTPLISHPDFNPSVFQQRLQQIYWHADTISMRANARRKLYLLSILATAIVGTLFYGIHGEVFSERVWLWFTFPVFVLTALVLHRMARSRRVEEKYLDARALAEALRVQFFWDVGGIRQSVDRYYLTEKRTELDWIRFALKNIYLLYKDVSAASATKPRFVDVLKYWIEDQTDWYREKANKQSHSVHMREKISYYGLLAAVGWSVLVPLSILIHGPWYRLALWKALDTKAWIEPIFHVVLVVPTLLAGAYRLWIEQAGYEEQSREYRGMERRFVTKSKDLKENLDSAAVAENLLFDLGVAALEENGRWLMLHRERPLEVLSSP